MYVVDFVDKIPQKERNAINVWKFFVFFFSKQNIVLDLAVFGCPLFIYQHILTEHWRYQTKLKLQGF